MNALVELSIDTSLEQIDLDQIGREQTGGRPEVRRRLSDKILAAFNHAYAVGEHDIAGLLKAALVQNEKQSGPVREMRKSYDPLAEAALWVGFVDARNTYRAACENGNDADAVAQALDAMKDAYRRWSQD